MKNKIGIGVLTCNRADFFKKCIDSIPEVDEIVVVNDGKPYDEEIYPSKVKELIQHGTNKCVGVSKNEALRYLMQKDCDHLFLVEDDMLIVNPEVCQKYIHAAEISGIWHLNFGYHGPANKDALGKKHPRNIIDYEDGVAIALNPNCVGAFSYYLRGVIKTVGYMDERFINAHDHTEHTYRIIKAGLHPPWWWFADVADSDLLINEQACSSVSTTIPRTEKWKRDYMDAITWFRHKHGIGPTEIRDTPQPEVIKLLEEIQNKYAKKVL